MSTFTDEQETSVNTEEEELQQNRKFMLAS